MENRFFVGTDCLNSALQCDTTSLKVMIASARIFGLGSNDAVS